MISYFKGDPSEHVMHYVKGRLVREGTGLGFFYWTRTASIVAVPLNTAHADFVFNEITSNFQSVTVQGLATYRIIDPKRASSMLNYAIHPGTRAYVTHDPSKLATRVTNLVQEVMRKEIQRLSLEDNLRKGADLARSTLESLQKSPDLGSLGVVVVNVFLTAVKPTPEVAKALEADYREALLKKADNAIYDRRAVAVEQERRIQENQMATEIALEKEKIQLVELKAANMMKEAKAEAEATAARLMPYQKMDPSMITAMGFMSLGENAGKIGSITITPDLLSELFKKQSK
jgi:regulator of protease activity HflC (stomatin/prohibitin superfamily)